MDGWTDGWIGWGGRIAGTLAFMYQYENESTISSLMSRLSLLFFLLFLLYRLDFVIIGRREVEWGGELDIERAVRIVG